MRLANRAAFVEERKMARGASGAGVGTRLHDARVKRAGTAAQGVKRKSGGDVGGVGENVGFVQRET